MKVLQALYPCCCAANSVKALTDIENLIHTCTDVVTGVLRVEKL